MKPIYKNQNGFAIVYAIVVLVLATIGGTSLLFLVQKDRTMVTDYVKMRSASLAAAAALRACEGQFQKNPAAALAILKKYTEDKAYKWMLGTAENADDEQKVTFWNNGDAPQYSACILGFDDNNYFITIQGTGYGSHGGKRRAIASYYLGGLKKYTPPSTTYGKFALFIARDGENFNMPMTINGNVYFGGKFRIQNYPMTINGYLKTGVSSSTAEIISGITINGNALFQCPAIFYGTSAINGTAGFAQSLSSAATLSLGADAYFNSTINSDGLSGIIDMQGNSATHSGLATTSYIKNAASIVNNKGTIDLETKVGICDQGETPVTINVGTGYIPSEKILTYKTVIGNNTDLTATRLNQYYSANPDKLWKTYLVVKIGTDDKPQFNSTSGTFTGKVIWIVEREINVNQTWYTSDTISSVSVIYGAGSANLNPFGWNGCLRGVIYITGSGTSIYSFGSKTILKGSIIHADAKVSCELTNINPIAISYDETVIQELVGLGIATSPAPSCGSTTSTGAVSGELILADVKIRPHLIGMQL